jgi:ABC-2 type transport system ATP-binding protein
MPIIEVSGLTKRFRVKQKEKGLSGSFRAILRPMYKEITAVGGLDFTVERGQMLAFLGPNGAGKSTTIKMLTGILYRDSGEIRVLELDPSAKRKALSYRIGTVFGQKEQLWMHLTPHDNFHFFGAVYDMTKAETEARVREFTELFEMGDILDTPVKMLSLGQRIKCEIAASLIHSPEILFLDEPTIGLDPVVKEGVRSLIKKMNAERGMTVFLTSHDVGDVEKLCKRVIIINNGQMVMDEGIDALKYRYLNKKIIEARLSEPLAGTPPEGISVLKRKENAVKLEVDTLKINMAEAIAWLGPERLADINISNVPLEEIISEVYKRA